MNILRGSVIAMAGVIGGSVLAWPTVSSAVTSDDDAVYKRDERAVDLVLADEDDDDDLTRDRFTRGTGNDATRDQITRDPQTNDATRDQVTNDPQTNGATRDQVTNDPQTNDATRDQVTRDATNGATNDATGADD